MTKAFTLCICMLLASPMLAAEKFDLRGPAPNVGDAVVTTTDQQHEEHPLRMTSRLPNRDVTFVIYKTTRLEQSIQTSILEEKDGSPIKVETRYLDFKKTSEQRTNLPNSAPTKSVSTSRQGAVLTATKTQKGWKTVGNDAAKHIPKRGYTDHRVAFPSGAVGVGQKWEAEVASLPHSFRSRLLTDTNGKAIVKFELTEIKQTDQDRIAVIQYSIKSETSREDTDNAGVWTMKTNLTGSGQIERNLTTYLDTIRFEAMEERKSRALDDDGNVTMTSTETIPITLRSSQRIVAPGQED